MSARTLRRTFAASIATLALVAAGAGAAHAADQITPDQYFGGTVYLADGSTGEDIALDATLDYDYQPIGLPAVGDLDNKFPIPAGAETVRTFIAPQGQEAVVSKWNAYADIGLTPGGVYLPNMTPLNQVGIGSGTPAGTNAVKSAGGDYSIGLAFLKTNNLYVVPGGLYFIHIHVTPGTGSYTYAQVVPAAAPLTPTTTSLSAPASATAGAAVNLSATVAPAAATGSVEFYDGSTLLGTSALTAGSASYSVAAGLSVGSHSITAKYLGDSAYDGSTSAPSTVAVAGQPVNTTTTVTATSATGYALSPVVLTATVAAANSTDPTGSVAFTGSVDGGAVQNLGTVPVGAGGVASLTKNNLVAGAWTINASFVGTGVYQASASTTAATLTLVVDATGTSSTDVQDVDVTIPAGAIEITTPYQGGNVFHLGTAVLDQATSTYSASAAFPNAADAPIKITDTRAGALGFTAKVTASDFVSTVDPTKLFSGSYAGLTDLVPTVPAGNLFSLAALHTTQIPANTPGLAAATPFAKYDAGNPVGTVEYRGTLGISGVPTSVIGGLYTATVTFTAS